MVVAERIGIVGVGYAVPAAIRKNDDPIFEWIKTNNPHGMGLFQGYKERRVLSPSETLKDIMVPAAQQALDDAKLKPEDIGILIGYASVSEDITPNALAQVYKELHLPDSCWIFPIDHEHTNFNDGLVLANALIQAGHDFKPADVGPETRALAELCLVLLNANEFVYVY